MKDLDVVDVNFVMPSRVCTTSRFARRQSSRPQHLEKTRVDSADPIEGGAASRERISEAQRRRFLARRWRRRAVRCA
jgi:hypothetical protein